MKRPKIVMTVIKEDDGYSAFTTVQEHFISTQADDYHELKKNVLEAVNLTFQEKGIEYDIEEIKFQLDLPSFFEFYKVINAKALSERIGMNQSLLSQYVSGKKQPSEKQTRKILEGVRSLGKELSQINFNI